MSWTKLLNRMRTARTKREHMACLDYAERCARKDRNTTGVTIYGEYADLDFEAEDAWAEARMYLANTIIPKGMTPQRWVRLSQMLFIGAVAETGIRLEDILNVGEA